MNIGEEHSGDITIVEIRGRIDSNTARAFGDRLTDLIKAGRTRVVIDLKNLAYSLAEITTIIVTSVLYLRAPFLVSQ